MNTLVAENSIEHSMVHLPGAKRALADGVLDDRGDPAALATPDQVRELVERRRAGLRTSGSGG